MAEQTPIKTTCPYCGVGCGVLATPLAGGGVAVQGDPEHPANYGKLCSKGMALGDTVGLEGRLLYPEMSGRRASWNEALDEVARRFAETIERHGPDAVAFYVSGQLLTEDYYVANKLMKGYIGSGNIDTNSRLCMSSTVAGHKRAFGEDVVPGCYEDLEEADLIVLVGSNTAWCHPVLYRRMAEAKAARGDRRMVVIDPRRTAACDQADLHLPLRPGTDVMLFNGLLNYLRRHDVLDFDYLEHHVSGFAATLAEVVSAGVPQVAEVCGLREEEVLRFYRLFAQTPKVVTAWSQGVNQSSAGTDKVNAMINVHLATGRIAKPGMGPFSLTGQPNAMGGREVGGLANQLAAHIDFGDEAGMNAVAGFWRAPRLARQPGLKAVDLFNAVDEGRIKALWIMATNPVVSLPDVRAVRRALARCDFVAVSDCEDATDLKPYAHVRLPALAWGEKSGTVTNSERRISRQRPFLAAPGEARADWWMVAEVARRMGHGEDFDYAGPHQIFAEHAGLSGHGNGGRRQFDISGLAELDQAAYDSLDSAQWPVVVPGSAGPARLYADGRYSHADGKARMIPAAQRNPVNATTETFPLILNTGRVRDQWHTMTRTARSARLNRHTPEPIVELHPADADRGEISAGELVRLRSAWGMALARAVLSEAQQPGAVFMPMHWSDVYGREVLVNSLVNPVTDPVSGEPESKHTPVTVEPFRPAWHAFLLTRQPVALPRTPWAVSLRGDGLWRYELAGDEAPAHWRDWLAGLMGESAATVDWLDYADAANGRYRCAMLQEQRLMACLFVGPNHELPARDWLAGLFEAGSMSSQDRLSLLSGRAPTGKGEARGPIVCACFDVGAGTIRRAIDQGCRTTGAIGAKVRAGTGCGSCLPELRVMLDRAHTPERA